MKPAAPFDPRLVVGMVAAGLIAFAGFLWILAFGPPLQQNTRDGRAHALSAAATGFRGIVALARASGDVELVRHRDWLRDEALTVFVAELNARPEEISELLEERRDLPTLVVLPKWWVEPHERRPGWVRRTGQIATELTSGMVEGVDIVHPLPAGRPGQAIGTDLLAGLEWPAPDAPQAMKGEGLEPLVALPGGGILVAQLGSQPHYVVADPDLLNNQGLADEQAARSAAAMLARFNSTDADAILFDLTLNGFAQGSGSNLLRTVLEPPFLAMTLALAAAALLAGLHGAFRFGPPRRPARAIPFGKAALVENSAGLIRLARREAGLGAAYVDVVRGEAARAAAVPAHLDAEAVDRHLDRYGRPGRPGFSELAARLCLARDRDGLVAAARELFQWRKDMIR